MERVLRSGAPGAYDAVVAGCIGIDTNVFLHGEDIDWTVEANFTQDLDYVGQAGGCCSSAFRSMGLRTAFLGALGDDFQGAEVRAALTRQGIDALFFPDHLGTHRSVNVMYRDGRRKNFYDGKGQMEVVPDLGACREWLAGSRVLHAQLENWVRHLLPLARELGVTVSCDLQDVVRLDDPYRREFIEYADLLFFSTVNFPEPEGVVRQFLAGRPGRIVVGGMGKEGAILGHGSTIRRIPAVESAAPVVDTNGAGDALATGFLTSLLFDGCTPEEAVMRGQRAARVCCAQRAAAKRFATRAELRGAQP
jgi:sugar/nucleoside kinase (ribokinase family)